MKILIILGVTSSTSNDTVNLLLSGSSDFEISPPDTFIAALNYPTAFKRYSLNIEICLYISATSLGSCSLIK